MRRNILIICYNYALSRRIANILSDRYNMRYFDLYEMFKFHNMPNTLADVLRINGKEFVQKKMRGILKDEFDFSGVVFVVDTKVIGENQDLYEKVKENNIVMFLKNDFKFEFVQRDNINFISNEEKDYFSLTIDKLAEYENIIEKNLADIVVDIDGLKYSEIRDKIIAKLENLMSN